MARLQQGVRFLFAALLLQLFLTACDDSNVKPGDRNYPKPNDHPTDWLLIHGTVDQLPDLDFFATWYATNKDCKFTLSAIEGAYAPYSAQNQLPVERNGSSFSVKVPIDGMSPSKCGWAFGGVTFAPASTVSPIHNSLVQTNSYPLKPGQSPDGVVRLRCENGFLTLGSPPPSPHLDCRWIEPEDSLASVNGGILWWHPNARNLEVHLTKGTCPHAWCTQADLNR